MVHERLEDEKQSPPNAGSFSLAHAKYIKKIVVEFLGLMEGHWEGHQVHEQLDFNSVRVPFSSLFGKVISISWKAENRGINRNSLGVISPRASGGHSLLLLATIFLEPTSVCLRSTYIRDCRDGEEISSLTSGTEQHPDDFPFPYTQYGESGNTSTTLVLCTHASDTQLDKTMVDLPCHLPTCKRIHE